MDERRGPFAQSIAAPERGLLLRALARERLIFPVPIVRRPLHRPRGCRFGCRRIGFPALVRAQIVLHVLYTGN